ncbi:MAG: branched-chain amino acid aminotransferase [Candidatus Adiutrix sp.]
MLTINQRILPKEQRRLNSFDEKTLNFGSILSDHMFKMDYFDGQWRNPRLEPYGPITLSPAAMGLHYGQLIFEGLKCFRRQDNTLALFRPKENFKRLARSAHKLCIPDFDQDLALEGLRQLIKTDATWVPQTFGTSLYIRPFIVATEPHLGVRPSGEYLFMIICGPVGAYYREGFAPIKIFVEPEMSRAAPGGLGDVKAASNYAASLYAAEIASQNGYTQLLWLDAQEHKYVEEVGSMNIFFVIGDTIITSPLKGTVLPGITRDSVITLLRQWGKNICERPLAISEIMEAKEKGLLKEAFGTGTAAVISPVGHLSYKGQEFMVGDGTTGPLTQRLYDEITAIQYGLSPDDNHWMMPI